MKIYARLHFAAVAMTALLTPQVEAQTREEIDRQPVTQLPKGVGQSISVNDGIERAPCPLAAPEFANISLTLNTANFRNLSGISADLLRPAYEGYIGKTISIATICEIRDRAATILRSKGYLAAIQVPPQRIEGGNVEFDVLVAKIVGFQVRGNAGKSEGLITGYLNAIKDQPVFNIIEAERYLLLARDIPGYDVRLTLRPAGTGKGEVVGEVLVDYKPIEAEANIQNYGSNETGRFGGLVQFHYNGLFGAGDRTTIGYFATADLKEQHVLQASEQIRIGREGLQLNADFAYAWSRPSLGPTLDLRSRTWVASLEARYPLIRRQAKNLTLVGGFDAINQRVNLTDVPFSLDKLRVAYARIDYDNIDASSIGSVGGYSASEPRWRFGGNLELRQGLSLLGNSKDCGPTLARCSAAGIVPIGRVEADTTAFVARSTFYGEYRPTPKIAVALTARGQYAPHPLLGYEEFSAGNFTVGRGYDPGILSGDSGAGLSGEFRLGSLTPASIKDTAFQAYAFSDAVWIWNKDISNPAKDPQRLVSAGGGFRIAYGDRINLDIGGAVPLKKAGLQAKQSGVRFLMNLTIRLLPWERR